MLRGLPNVIPRPGSRMVSYYYKTVLIQIGPVGFKQRDSFRPLLSTVLTGEKAPDRFAEPETNIGLYWLVRH